jgi:hypothetical protein
MLDAHGYYPETFGRPHPSVFNHKIHHALNLSRGALLLCSVAGNVRQYLVPKDLCKTRTRKGHQSATVDPVI